MVAAFSLQPLVPGRASEVLSSTSRGHKSKKETKIISR